MDVSKLRYFIAVAEERNISRAAARLHISQPPLTRHIQTLEEDLGVQLFKRTSWGVELTQAGEILLADAHNIRSLVDQATDRVQRAGKGQVGRLDIGVFGSGALQIVPEILSAYTGAYPAVKIVLHNTHRTLQIEALRQGRALIAFDRYLPAEPDVATEVVAHEPFMVALNTRNPLAAQDEVAIEQLGDEQLVIGGAPGSDTSSIILGLCRAHGVEPRIVQEVEDMITCAALVASGFGASLVPASMLNLQLPNLVYRPLREGQDAFMDLHCYYLKNESSPLLRALLATIGRFRDRAQAEGGGAQPPRQAQAAAGSTDG